MMLSKKRIVVGLGEVLFDCFPDREVLGGAPANVAVHAGQLLRGVGGSAVVLSRIGVDALGERLLNELSQRDIACECLQRDPDHPTGRVQVTLDPDGHAEYDIEAGAAWDHLAFDETTRQVAECCAAVCYGTLAQRTPQSRQTIHAFLEASPQALHVYDVNLRQDYYSAELLEMNLRRADVVKLNEHELPQVCELLQLSQATEALDHLAEALRGAYTLQLVALTRGEHGTQLFSPEEIVTGQPATYPRQPQADTVGAGDACCAALVTGLLLKWPLQTIADFANQVGAFVAMQPGATPRLPEELLRRVMALTPDNETT